MRCCLPVEVYERIVDYNWSDPPTLLAWALVCRDLSHRSRYHLQRETTMTIRSATELRCIGDSCYRNVPGASTRRSSSCASWTTHRSPSSIRCRYISQASTSRS
ncbi:uncharacterized protein B0H18DRAFT_664400 [Fomitopsis serialis]|uniref:uncharacterized protein n=1 Tax=Fomitopsis serialis TaxID=139415 RepID=UPI0020078992|nr:uncharacterized protein B0H18DRAFT_664400 [Neoantrodia serialis]KAH9918585.1 hypothetical protein B0H18DRAFT_664400 [Neoantrodia serialis]